MKNVWSDKIFSRSSHAILFSKNSYSRHFWKIRKKAPVVEYYQEVAVMIVNLQAFYSVTLLKKVLQHGVLWIFRKYLGHVFYRMLLNRSFWFSIHCRFTKPILYIYWNLIDYSYTMLKRHWIKKFEWLLLWKVTRRLLKIK